MSNYTYELKVDQIGDDEYLAYLDDPKSPLRGYGTSPLEAIRMLCESIKEWPLGGSDRWLATAAGVELARKFVPGFTPGKPGGAA